MQTFLLLGSNVGDRADNLKQARRFISENISPVAAQSSVYETAPWGNKNQPAFLNMAVMTDTNLKPAVLLEKLKHAEKTLGRTQTEIWGPRLIDIDILLMGELVHNSETLTVPHPRLHERRFALVPLAEIAPGALHPALSLTIRELLARCPDDSDARLFSPTASLPSR